MLQGALPQMRVARKAAAGWGQGVQQPGGEAPPRGRRTEHSTQTPEALQQGRACSQTLSL